MIRLVFLDKILNCTHLDDTCQNISYIRSALSSNLLLAKHFQSRSQGFVPVNLCLWRPAPGTAFVSAIECTSCRFNQIVATELYSLWSINAWFIAVPNPFTPITIYEWPTVKVQRTKTGILLIEYNASNGRRIDVRGHQIIVMDGSMLIIA